MDGEVAEEEDSVVVKDVAVHASVNEEGRKFRFAFTMAFL